MDNIIYLDNAATTKPCEEALAAFYNSINNYYNPSSVYSLGCEAKCKLNNSRKTIENILNVTDGTFYFTSGATESNNWAVFGAANANKRSGMHIVAGKTEHPSVLEPLKALEKSGFEVSYIEPLLSGVVNEAKLLQSIRNDTVLVTVMHVNNETGAINNINKIAESVKRINKKTLIHTDAVCSFCKLPINIKNVDLLSVSGHKLHTPKGIGGLYIKSGIKISPLIFGGGQEKAMRSGTENTAYIDAFAAAAKTCADDIGNNLKKISHLKEKLMRGLLSYNFAAVIGSKDKASSSPYILNMGFKGYKSQLILNALEQKKIFVSAGSACASNKSIHSKSISALNIDTALVEGSIRFSFSKYNTEYDINCCLEALSYIFKAYCSS